MTVLTHPRFAPALLRPVPCDFCPRPVLAALIMAGDVLVLACGPTVTPEGVTSEGGEIVTVTEIDRPPFCTSALIWFLQPGGLTGSLVGRADDVITRVSCGREAAA